MAQVTQATLDNTGFPAFRSNLNNTINALNSNHIGSSRPGSAVAGTIWIDNSVTNTFSIKCFDGTDDLELFSINTSTNAITLPSGVSVSETDPNSIPFAVALGS
jgi:hypothetical protein|tara:strand:+ start:721 stop:1032 length:312 start_codon:yes stop_codon:yes gene_type:complete